MGGRKLGLMACAIVGLAAFKAEACTRILYETGNHTYIVGRTMDWAVDPHSDLWSFPKGMERDGGVGPKSVKWTAKYGSVIASFDNVVTVDGMNEAGLVANTLYLVEFRLWRRRKIRQAADLGGRLDTNMRSTISRPSPRRWTRYPRSLSQSSRPIFPGGKKAGGHLSLADASGDSAIFEYLGGKLVIHHDPKYTVMTNSPTFDQQLALNAYWQDVGGIKFLPGTARSADRFVRVSWNLGAAPKETDPRLADATVFSLIRTVSVPLGLADPERPNIAATVWRTVADIKAKRYFFEFLLQSECLLGRPRQAEA